MVLIISKKLRYKRSKHLIAKLVTVDIAAEEEI
jgi:hypothetical protein